MKIWSKLAARDRRAVLLGALILGGALALRFVALPYLRARSALAARVEEQEGLLRRELALVRGMPEEARSVREAAQAFGRARRQLLDGRDALGAAAGLIGEVSGEARRHGVLIEGVEGQATDSLGGGLVAVQVAVRGRSDFEGLLRWLYTVETGETFLRVEQLSVARLASGSGADSLDSENLAFAASIRGFAIARGGMGRSAALAAGAGSAR